MNKYVLSYQTSDYESLYEHIYTFEYPDADTLMYDWIVACDEYVAKLKENERLLKRYRDAQASSDHNKIMAALKALPDHNESWGNFHVKDYILPTPDIILNDDGSYTTNYAIRIETLDEWFESKKPRKQ